MLSNNAHRSAETKTADGLKSKFTFTQHNSSWELNSTPARTASNSMKIQMKKARLAILNVIKI